MKTATRPEELSSRAHGQHNTDIDEAPSKIARLLVRLLIGEQQCAVTRRTHLQRTTPINTEG